MLLNAGLSDRMSRSEMAFLLPSPPTALQVMIVDIADDILESKIPHVHGVWSKWVGWALHVTDGVWHPHSLVLPCYSLPVSRRCLRQRPPTCQC